MKFQQTLRRKMPQTAEYHNLFKICIYAHAIRLLEQNAHSELSDATSDGENFFFTNLWFLLDWQLVFSTVLPVCKHPAESQ